MITLLDGSIGEALIAWAGTPPGPLWTTQAMLDRPAVTPARHAAVARGRVDLGATLIGGCCATGPAHVAATAAALRGAGHRLA